MKHPQQSKHWSDLCDARTYLACATGEYEKLSFSPRQSPADREAFERVKIAMEVQRLKEKHILWLISKEE